LGTRSEARQRYRLLEMLRWRAKRSLEFNLHPLHFPSDPRLADGVVLAALHAGLDPEPLIQLAYQARWCHHQNLEDPQILARITDEAGLPGGALVAVAPSADITSIYEQNLQRAIASGVFGAPSFILDGELFWGQDRIEMLDETLTLERPPYVPEGSGA
jgi:2-hydroxychromene-2-carboxylate isomerase